MDQVDEVARLRHRIKVLEERIQGLRASRRILMNLLAAQEREKRARIQHLERENSRLHRRSTQYAQALLDRNIRIVRLQQSLERAGADIS